MCVYEPVKPRLRHRREMVLKRTVSDPYFRFFVGWEERWGDCQTQVLK